GLEGELKSLSQSERRALRQLGVRIGAFALHLPELACPAHPFVNAFALAAAPEWRPAGRRRAVLRPGPRGDGLERARSPCGAAGAGVRAGRQRPDAGLAP